MQPVDREPRYTLFLDGERIHAASRSELIAKARVLGYELKRERRDGRVYWGVERAAPSLALSEVPHV